LLNSQALRPCAVNGFINSGAQRLKIARYGWRVIFSPCWLNRKSEKERRRACAAVVGLMMASRLLAEISRAALPLKGAVAAWFITENQINGGFKK